MPRQRCTYAEHMRHPAGPLISAEALHELLGSPDLVVLDARWSLADGAQREAYEAEHLPGAAFVDFDEALSGPPGDGGRHPMPSLASFGAAMRAAGVDNTEYVVVYDEGNSLSAARLWWLLRYFGHRGVQVLDGGLERWRSLGLPTRDTPEEIVPGDFVPTPGHLPLLDADGAAEYAERHLLIDGRPRDRFAGRNETIDPIAGHIPGAVNSPALSSLSDDGRFLTPDDLAMQFTAAGVHPDQPVGVYCGSGVQAMHLALALSVSGLDERPAVYVGSWSDWIRDPERPVSPAAD